MVEGRRKGGRGVRFLIANCVSFPSVSPSPPIHPPLVGYSLGEIIETTLVKIV